MAQNAALAARVVELEAKPGLPPKMPDNPSLPPSKGQKPSRPSVPKRKAKPHPGAHRLLHPNPTRPHDVLAVSCQACGADVSRTEQSPREVRSRVGIPTTEPDETRVSLHGGTCPCCATRFDTDLVSVDEQSWRNQLERRGMTECRHDAGRRSSPCRIQSSLARGTRP